MVNQFFYGFDTAQHSIKVLDIICIFFVNEIKEIAVRLEPVKRTPEENAMMVRAWQSSAIRWIIAISIAYGLLAFGTWLMPN